MFGSKKTHIDAFLSWPILPKRYKLGMISNVTSCHIVKKTLTRLEEARHFFGSIIRVLTYKIRH